MEIRKESARAESLARRTMVRATRAAVVVFLVTGLRLVHAEIYVSDQSGHSARFANHPLDATYQLHIRNETPAQLGVPQVLAAYARYRQDERSVKGPSGR